MDLYLYEQRLRDEVIYLHSLWRQGPPTATTTTTTTTTNKRNRIQNDNISNSPNKKNRTNDDNNNNNLRLSEPGPWPTPAQFPTPASSSVGPATAQEMATHYAALKLQHRASNAFRESLPKSDEDGGGDAKYRFFFRVFMEDGELRRYYEENSECGEFYCLVCCGLGQEKKKKNLGKMFKTCLGLVHHSARMAKTEGNFSHKAFAEVVCRVLGWDFDRLPIIVSKGEPLSRTLGKFECEGSCKDAKNIDKKEMIDGQSEKPISNSPSAGLERLALPSPAGLVLAEEQARFAAMQFQHKAVKACQEFLASHSGSGSDESDNEDEEESDESDSEDEEEDPSEDSDEEDPSEDSDEDDGNVSKDCEAFKFFEKLFMEDGKLWDYYMNNYEDGEFCCLVCGGMEESVWKSFRGCVALVQHLAATSNTNKKLAHRAYGQAICQILGWDINISRGESLSQTLAKLGNSQGRKRPLVSSSEWPCEKPTESSPSAVLEWPPFVLRSGSAVSSLSAEERAKFDADLLQHKAVKACQDFLTNNSSAKSDDDEDEDASEDSDEDEDASEDNDEHDDEDGNTDASNNAKEFHFFLQLFIDNDKLREFYVKNFKGGEFCCLVCSGIGNKVWKRYIGCVALVQHSNSILKTKKKVAHRAYGKVICQVLGWDFNRFPSILLNGESHGQSLVKLDSLQGEPGENSDGHKNDLCCKNNLDSLDGDNNSKIVLEKSSE